MKCFANEVLIAAAQMSFSCLVLNNELDWTQCAAAGSPVRAVVSGRP